MTELKKYDRSYFQNMRAFMEDDELNGLLSTNWNADFKSLPEYRPLETISTFSFLNVKVRKYISLIFRSPRTPVWT